MGRSSAVLVVILASCIPFASPAAAEGPSKKPPAGAPVPKAKPVFEIDGAAVDPWVVSGRDEDGPPREGDIVYVNGFYLALGPGPDYRFRTSAEEKDRRVHLLLPGGGERLVGAGSAWTLDYDHGNAWVVENHLEGLSDAELGGLWGVVLDGWNDGVAAKVDKINGARTCVTVTDACGGPGSNVVRPMPVLPPGLRYLVLDENSSEGMTDLSSVRMQTGLQVFRTNGFSRVPFDLSLLTPSAATLRVLHLRSATVSNRESLADFHGLRDLDLSWNEGFSNLEPVRAMTLLRTLHMQGTAVTDLGPLSGLTKLAAVHANGSAVAVLPSGALPALRTLELYSTKVSDADAAAFVKTHPGVDLSLRWNEGLRKALATADRVVLRTGGTCHRDPQKEKRLWEGEGAATVKELVALMVVDEEHSGDSCMCCGTPSFEFYRGTEELLTLGFHHGQGLRWPGGWPGDGALTREQADRLVDWLAEHGAPGPRQDRDRIREEEAQRQREDDAFLAAFPGDVREYFRTESLGENPWERDEKKTAAFAAAMATKCGGAEGLAVSLCRAMGASSTGWTEQRWKEMKAVACLRAVDGEAFAGALAKLKDEPAALGGAARLAFREGMFAALSPEERSRWGAILGRVALDGDPLRGWTVAHSLATADGPEIRKLLLAMVEKGNPEGANQQPSLPVAALIALGRLGEPGVALAAGARLVKETDATERRGLEVALALAGEPVPMKPAHFADRSWTIALGALEVLARSERREGIEALVAAMRLDSVGHGFDMADGFFRATGWSCRTEGRNYGWIHGQCIAWWEKNGAAFLQKVRGGK